MRTTSQRFAVLREMQRRVLAAAEKTVRGPMAKAFVTRNPILPEEYFAPKGLDPLVVEMNEGAEYSLLNIEFHKEGGGEWIGDTGSLSAMLGLRDDIVRGDYRALTLAWLKVLEVEDLLDSVREPPVPPPLAMRLVSPCTMRTCSGETPNHSPRNWA